MNGLLIGRFQPFHLGHIEAILFALSKVDKLWIGIGSSNKSSEKESVFLIRKTAPADSSPAMKELHARNALAIGKRWAPQVYVDVVPVVKTGSGYALGLPGEVLDYALELNQVSAHYWLHNLIPQGKFPPAAVSKVARYLAEHHREIAGMEVPPEAGRPENLRDLAEEVFYQVKKYIDVTVAPPLVDTVARPMLKFIEDHRKLFLRRHKKGLIVECHGAFVPEHIYIKGREVFAVSPLTVSRKFRILDVANDVATLANDLQRLGAAEERELFVKRYTASARDRDIATILPAYQTLQAMRSGLSYSESLSGEDLTDEQRAELGKMAQSYFQLAVQASREIPR